MSELHVMVDLETLSTKTDAAILQISAVLFDPMGVDVVARVEFNEFPTLESQPDRRIDSTLFWWLRQSPEAQRVQTEARRIPLDLALAGLRHWYSQIQPRPAAIWSHGATFDIAILNHAYHMAGQEPPWGYREPRDTRTLFADAALVRSARGVEKSEPPLFAGVQHDALADARNQAILVQHAHLDLVSQ